MELLYQGLMSRFILKFLQTYGLITGMAGTENIKMSAFPTSWENIIDAISTVKYPLKVYSMCVYLHVWAPQCSVFWSV